MILYPTETIYALGVHALDEAELALLFQLKGRVASKSVSWLVRSVADIERYAVLDPVAAALANRYLPGPLTLVLPVRPGVPLGVVAPDGTIGFRISSDPIAQQIVADFMNRTGAPLTCTSANISGSPTLSTPTAILKQFGASAQCIDTIYDDGERAGTGSTVVSVIGGVTTIVRQGTLQLE